MIRKATLADVAQIAQTYEDLFSWEEAHGSVTHWKRGVYPTATVPLTRIPAGEMYVLEEGGAICASMAIDHAQAAEYADVDWAYPAKGKECLVIHTLCVPPKWAHRGYGRQMVRYAMEEAQKRGCKVVRLDTCAYNEPARNLYQSLGFLISGDGPAKLAGVLPIELVYLERRV